MLLCRMEPCQLVNSSTFPHNGIEKNKSDSCLVISDKRHSVYYFLDADDTDDADLFFIHFYSAAF